VGRAAEIATARALLLDAAVPLLTLTGPGGVGKTRLALAIADDVASAFADGAVFVDLSPIRDPALVMATIAEAVGVRERGERPLAAQLAAALRPRQLLLVLDNCEQVLAAAEEIASLIAACPAVQVIATSRAPLRVQGEHLLPAPPLALPDPGPAHSLADLGRVEAIALFVARARAADPAFALTRENGATVAEICRRLDGLPLAIELAAARLRALSLTTLLPLLSERMRVLTGGERDRPDRQRTLRDTIAWSHDLLTADEQILFRRLAVFAGGFDAEAAATVCGVDPLTALDRLTALVDKSLIRRVVDPDGMARWTLLETIREFGLGQLRESGEESAVRDRHVAWCVATVETAWPPRTATLPDDRALLRLDAERDNLRAALEWAIGRGQTDAALRLTGGLAETWVLRGDFTEARAWTERALALPGGLPALRASALYGASSLAVHQGDIATAQEHAETCLSLARTHGDSLDVLRAEFTLCLVANRRGDATQQAAHAEIAAALAREIGDASWLGYASLELGAAVRDLGDVRRAAVILDEALRLCTSVGDRWGELNGVIELAIALYRGGEPARSAPLFRRGATLARDLASPWGAKAFVGLAAIAASEGRAERAAQLLGATETLCASIDYRFGPESLALRDSALGTARTQLGETGFAAAWEAGRALPAGDAVALALAADDSSPVLPAAPSKAAPSAASVLSAREREVLALLAQRQTTNEIAATLFLSPRTVESHTSSIFNKLGVSSRREAAALAARHGLA
jgi:non-specific serine/threonine protein kinase